MLSSVSTLLLCLVISRSVVYQNGIGVMNIQFAEEYKNAEKGETERGFLEQSEPGLERGRTLGAGAREKESEPGARTLKMESEPGLERGRTLGAGAREKESEPGARTRKMESEPGPERR